MCKPLTFCLACLAVPFTGVTQLQVQAAPAGFSGELERSAEESVTLMAKDDKEVVVAMMRGWTISRPHDMEATAIKQGEFVATANKVVDGHAGQSTEVCILESGYRPEYGTHLMGPGDNAWACLMDRHDEE